MNPFFRDLKCGLNFLAKRVILKCFPGVALYNFDVLDDLASIGADIRNGVLAASGQATYPPTIKNDRQQNHRNTRQDKSC